MLLYYNISLTVMALPVRRDIRINKHRAICTKY